VFSTPLRWNAPGWDKVSELLDDGVILAAPRAV